MQCPQCGSMNDDTAKICSSCGAELSTDKQPSSLSQEEYYRTCIGPKNQDYYMRHFQRFTDNGKTGISWHWPAFFFTFYWLLYRKMWLLALGYFLLPSFVMIPMVVILGLAGVDGDVAIAITQGVLLLGTFLLPPMFANAFYYHHCNRKIREVQKSSANPQHQLGELAAKGGTSHAALIVILVLAFVALIGILAAIAIPAYQSYVVRARVNEALITGDNASLSVTEYYYQYQQVPATLADAGFKQDLPAPVKSIEVDSSNGIITITLANDPVKDTSLLLVPSLDENNQINWKCQSETIRPAYLPARCKTSN